MSLQAQESQTSVEIQAISARIAFLEKLNKLTYDTTLFTRKLRWLLRRALTEKPTVAEVADLMNKELEISRAQIEVSVEGVADELKLEVKQGIIALKAGLAFIEDNYKSGSDPEADAIIAKIRANLENLEARFGKKSGTVTPVESTGEVVPTPESSTAAPVPQSTAEVPPVPQSTAEVPPVQQSSTAEVPVEPSSTAEAPTPVVSSTAETPSPAQSTGGETASETGSTGAPVEASTTEVPPVSGGTAVPSITLEGSSSTGFNATNSSSSSTGEEAVAESPISATAF
jgi:hypothetical protein